MKNKLTLIALFVVFTSTIKLNAQEICMVTSDYQQGENFLIMWEQFSDFTNLDSVLIYRMDTSTNYNYVGGEKIGPTEITYFQDVTSNTKEFAKYVMYVKDSAGVLTGPSLWHQPTVLDYTTDGTFSFTMYQIENGPSMYYYTAYYDPTGLGFYQYLNTNINYTNNTFVDTGFVSHPTAFYYIEAVIQSCDVHTKAEINTSRSNIKQQIATADLGLTMLEADNSNIIVSPNPVNDLLTIDLSKKNYHSGAYELKDLNGKIVARGNIASTMMKLDADKFESGMYILQITLDDQLFVKRIIKK